MAVDITQIQLSDAECRTLAEVAENIGELDDRDPRRKGILLTRNPLPPSAARPQHEDGGHEDRRFKSNFT